MDDKIIFFLFTMIILILAIGVHEFAHAYIADLSGDPTPRMMGRVTLNPIAHLDPMGTLFMAITAWSGYGIGWGKPVMVRHDKMNNPRWDSLLVAIAGPISNLLQAAIFAVLFRGLSMSGPMNDLVELFLLLGVIVNVSLAVFNMIPLGPLDGHWIVGAFLPEPIRTQWFQFNRGIGSFVFLALVLIPVQGGSILGIIMGPIADFLTSLLLGDKALS
ncbi:SpoIVFB Zn-dependent proteases [Fimbriimonadaceae bacterium]